MAGAEVVGARQRRAATAGLLAPRPANVVTAALTDAAGNYSLTLRPAAYTVVANLDGTPYEGGGSTPVAHPVDGRRVRAPPPRTSRCRRRARSRSIVTDESAQPIPAKASVVGFDPSPVLTNTQTCSASSTTAPASSATSAGRRIPFGARARALHRSERRLGRRADRAGQLSGRRLARARVLGRRAERHRHGGRHHPVTPQIARVIDTTGFVGSDFHVHSHRQPRLARCARRDRVVTMLAEGIDFFTPSDHDFRADFAPDIAAISARRACSAPRPAPRSPPSTTATSTPGR